MVYADNRQQLGAPSNREIPMGKRVITKDHMTVANGQMRLMGGDRDDVTSQANRDIRHAPRKGKRVIQMPYQPNMNVLQ